MDKVIGFCIVAACIVFIGGYFVTGAAFFATLVCWALADTWPIIVIAAILGFLGGLCNVRKV